MQTNNLICYTCEMNLTRQEIFYIYQCNKCFNRTSYCLRCNKTMDNLLNGLFFKCFSCKVLTRIVHRESISPEHSSINKLLYNNSYENNVDNEVKGLFHPSMINENSTPIKNFISGCFNPMHNPIGNSHFVNQNIINNPMVTQNLLKNFNQATMPVDGVENNNIKNECNSNNMNTLFQTPKTNYKFDRNFLFSPGDNFDTPIQSKTINQEHSINLRDLGIGYSTPRNISRIISASGSNNKTPGSLRTNNMEDGVLSVDDFDNKLVLQRNQLLNNNNNNNIGQSYSILANRNRVSRIMGTKFNINNLSVNKLNNSKGTIIDTRASEFAGYNKTEPPRRSVSKSPLSLRKRKKQNFLNSENKPINPNTPFILNNQNNTESQQVTCPENTLFLSNFKPTSFVNFTDENLNHQQKFGASSYLSDIKPVNNYASTLDNSKFSFSTTNGFDNFFKLNNNNPNN